jgi:hypothetical protein
VDNSVENSAETAPGAPRSFGFRNFLNWRSAVED